MTTIIADAERRVLLADTLSTTGRGVVVGQVSKLTRIAKIGWVGVAGPWGAQARTIETLIDALWDGEPYTASSKMLMEKPALDNTQVLLMWDDPDLEIEEYYEQQGRLFLSPTRPPQVIGTGWEIALGALEAGATPEKAMEIACKRDVYTAPPIEEAHAEEDVVRSINPASYLVRPGTFDPELLARARPGEIIPWDGPMNG